MGLMPYFLGDVKMNFDEFIDKTLKNKRDNSRRG